MADHSLSAIIELLNPDNTISAHRMLAHAIGMTETVIYSALISKQTYYSRNGMLYEGGWFYSTVCDLQESTTFGAKAQKTAVRHLIEHGMIECEYKGLPAKRYFRIINDTDNLMRLIDEGVEISRKIVSKSKNIISEKSQKRSSKQNKENDMHGLSKENNADRDEQTAVSCDSPAAIPCSYPSAGTRTYPVNNKTKDNNKPKKNNPKFKSIYQSNKSVKRRDVEKKERKNFKPMKFTEILANLGLDWYDITPFEPKSEKDFEYRSERSRQTKKCKIPYTLKNDKRDMKAALRYLCAYSYNFSEGEDEPRRILWETMICAIAEMVENDSIRVKGGQIMYYEIIDRLNDIISRSYISECFDSFEDRWTKIIAEKKITHPKAYMKSCLWSWLCDFEFEEYNEIKKLE